MKLKESLGKNIKYYRKKKGLTQEQLAELVNIHDKNLSKIENGNNYPSAETLSTIVKALDIDFYELFLFNNEIDYEQMKSEIIQSLDDNKNILALYKYLKNIT